MLFSMNKLIVAALVALAGLSAVGCGKEKLEPGVLTDGVFSYRLVSGEKPMENGLVQVALYQRSGVSTNEAMFKLRNSSFEADGQTPMFVRVHP